MWTGGCRYPFAGSALGLDRAPLPIAATLEFGTGAWSVTFDRFLAAGALDPSNWTFRATDFEFTAGTATALGTVVSGGSVLGKADVGANVANFAPPPFDVVGPTGIPAVAFTDLPLTVT